MHILIALTLFAACMTTFVAAIMLAIYALHGYRPRAAYILGSIACAIAAPSCMALQIWLSSKGSLTLLTCLNISSLLLAAIYTVVAIPTSIGFAIDWYRFRTPVRSF